MNGSSALFLPNSAASIRQRTVSGAVPRLAPLGMVFVRIGLFAAYQTLAALLFFVAGRAAPWQASIAWWPVTATAANLTCLGLLYWLAGREGMRLRHLYNFDRRTIRRDLLLIVGLLLIGGPLGYLPNAFLAQTLFGSAEAASELWLLPLPPWVALAVAILFPLTIALSELPTYFGYALPRLQVQWHRRWLPVLLTAFMLSAQHIALPLILDGRFMVWRLASFLLFALFLGLLIDWRPRLLPYLMVVHGLMDFSVIIYIVIRSLA